MSEEKKKLEIPHVQIFTFEEIQTMMLKEVMTEHGLSLEEYTVEARMTVRASVGVAFVINAVKSKKKAVT